MPRGFPTQSGHFLYPPGLDSRAQLPPPRHEETNRRARTYPRQEKKMATLLEQLRAMTVTVADTGDINSIAKFKPRDATTNPSLITAAAQMAEYREVVDDALRWAE